MIASGHLSIAIYLADQNPQRDRSLGITSMTRSLIQQFTRRDDLNITQIISKSSFRSDDVSIASCRLPFRTDRPIQRLVADKSHCFWARPNVDLWYYPKGYASHWLQPNAAKVGTMHDTIVQYYADHYPETRSRRAFDYWIHSTQVSLRKFDRVLTVSQASADQLRQFCDRYHIKPPTIEVTYEGSTWESRRGETFDKQAYAVHLASPTPHKGTNRLLGHWKTLQQRGVDLPELLLVGKLDEAGKALACELKNVSQKPPLESGLLQQTVGEAAVLLLPSEIEGFGLPALEAYYVGTPVCFAAGTSVSEVVDPMGHGGCYAIDDPDGFSKSLDWALGLSSDVIDAIGGSMHQRFSLAKVSDRIVNAFRSTIK